MPRTYLRMLVSSLHEEPFVRMNVLEAREHVDEILVCEANRTHTGEPKELLFSSVCDKLAAEGSQGVRYMPIDLDGRARPYNNSSAELHRNEQLIRNAFAEEVALAPDDIVVAVDADEVIFRDTYPWIKKRLGHGFLGPSCLNLILYQFAFRMNYYWKGRDWRAPVACRAGVYLNDSDAQWRYRGVKFPRRAGAHFAWVMSPDDMAAKIMRYSHRVELEHLADAALLKEAVDSKRYIFDESVDFRVVELAAFDARTQPQSILDVQSDYPVLFSDAWNADGEGPDR